MDLEPIEKFVKKANIFFLKDFLDAAVKCGEITEIGKERIKGNKALKDFFDEGRDELVEELEYTVKELSILKERIRGEGLEYLLEDPLTDDNWEKYPRWNKSLQNCQDDFIQVTFKGAKEGYTFKTDSQGTGYYKDGAIFELEFSSSEESSEEEDLIECDGCSRVWDGNAQCPCGMEQETFEGRKTFPTECTDATNQFILRYIAEGWQGLTYRKVNYGDEVAYIITKRRSEDAAPTHSPEYTLNGKGSCGIMSMDSDWGRDGFILDLKGKEFKVINNFLEDLMNILK